MLLFDRDSALQFSPALLDPSNPRPAHLQLLGDRGGLEPCRICTKHKFTNFLGIGFHANIPLSKNSTVSDQSQTRAFKLKNALGVPIDERSKKTLRAQLSYFSMFTGRDDLIEQN